jgi:hypothetical protein
MMSARRRSAISKALNSASIARRRSSLCLSLLAAMAVIFPNNQSFADAPSSEAASPDAELVAQLDGLRRADMTLDQVRYRLALANDDLCQKHGPLTGLMLQSSNDYDAGVQAAVRAYFHFEGATGVEGVVSGSPAAAAGIEAGDTLMAINGRPLPADDHRTDALATIDAAGPTAPLHLTVSRAGRTVAVVLQPLQGCLVHAEVDINDELNAATDGHTIEVDSALINLIGSNEQALAAVVAHELSHIVLDHPDRLTAAHVDRGLLKGFGRNKRLIERTESEADRLSVTLMANAGYDPQAAVHYWLTYGPQIDRSRGLFNAHMTWRERARLIAAAAAAIPAGAAHPIVPSWIASRDRPLD